MDSKFDLHPLMPEPVLPEWDDIVRLRRYSPHLHACLTMHQRGDLTREQALILAVIMLYNVHGNLTREACCVYCGLTPQEATTAKVASESRPIRHITKANGECVSWCYGCERAGLQERVKFTADYESLKLQLADAHHEIAEKD